MSKGGSQFLDLRKLRHGTCYGTQCRCSASLPSYAQEFEKQAGAGEQEASWRRRARNLAEQNPPLLREEVSPTSVAPCSASSMLLHGHRTFEFPSATQDPAT
jgi:hypothetical protein